MSVDRDTVFAGAIIVRARMPACVQPERGQAWHDQLVAGPAGVVLAQPTTM